MPELIEVGPQQMLERAKVNGLIVPLEDYSVSVYGAYPSELMPKIWMVVKDFWTRYFAATGAELAVYSG